MISRANHRLTLASYLGGARLVRDARDQSLHLLLHRLKSRLVIQIRVTAKLMLTPILLISPSQPPSCRAALCILFPLCMYRKPGTEAAKYSGYVSYLRKKWLYLACEVHELYFNLLQ